MYISSLTYHHRLNSIPLFELEGKPAHISLVHNHEMVLNQHPDLEFRILLFRNEILRREFWVRNVHRDDLLSRCVLVRYQVEECTVVPDASRRKE